MKVDNCTRYRRSYRGLNLYITVSSKRIDISTENSDKFKTLAGLGFIRALINEVLSLGGTIERIAELGFEESYGEKNTLPIITHDAVMVHIDRGNNG